MAAEIKKRRKAAPRVASYSEEGSEYETVSTEEMKEDTRSEIAQRFITGYLLIIITLILLSTFFHLPADVAKDFLLAIGTPLGFIIGYYFKSDK